MDDNMILERLDEMYESMKESVKNIQSVIEQQRELLSVLENSEKKEIFSKFIEGVTDQIDEFTHQIDELNERINIYEELKNINFEDNLETIIMMTKFLGLFRDF